MKSTSLRTRFMWIFMAVILVAVGGAVINGHFTRHLKEERLGQVMREDLGILWQYIVKGQQEAIESNKVTLTRNRAALKALGKSDEAALAEAVEPTWTRMWASNLIDGFQVLDKDAQIRFAKPEPRTGRNTMAAVQKAIAEQKITRDIVMDSDGKIKLVVVVPLYSRGKVAGAGVFLHGLWPVLEELQQLAGGEAFLTDASHNVLEATAPELAGHIDVAAALRTIASGEKNFATDQGEGKHYFMTGVTVGPDAEAPLGWLLSAKDQTEAVANERFLDAVTIAGIASIGLFMLLLVRWTLTSACADLTAVARVMGRMAEGDLTATIDVDRKDEIGSLQEAAGGMIRKLWELLSRVSGSSDGLANASNQLTAISSQTKTDIEHQKDQTQQLALAMKQMLEAVSLVASNAEETAEAARLADVDASQGSEIVNAAASNIGDLAAEVDQGVTHVRALQKDADSIGSVLDVIGGIAEQTNLLALNAAIEAARAGEQGRGFAVVADEVRTLAGRTQEATKEIQQMIDTLQNRVSSVATTMERGRETAQTGVEHANESGQALERIGGRVLEIAQMVAQIAAAAEQQNEVVQEVNQSVGDISEVAGRTAEGTQQTDAANENLARMTDELRQVMSLFKMREDVAER